jgi:hypothetical protein
MAYDRDSLDQIFRQALGRPLTDSEEQFLKPYIDQGFISHAQIGQQGFQNALTAGNQQILGDAAKAADSSFAQMGRQYSTGQGNAVIQAGQQLAAQQAPLLGQFYGQNQQGLNDQYANFGMSQLQRGYDKADSETAFQRQQQMYFQQQNDGYMNQQNKQNRTNALIGLGGAALGAAAGGLLPGGSALGALVGAKVGGGLGGVFR